MVWGRYHTEGALEAQCEILDVDFFICGRQQQETRFDVVPGYPDPAGLITTDCIQPPPIT